VIWNHCNRCVFDGQTPSIPSILRQTDDERRLWELAGAKGLLLGSFFDKWLNPTVSILVVS
jgi:hypothetical protein